MSVHSIQPSERVRVQAQKRARSVLKHWRWSIFMSQRPWALTLHFAIEIARRPIMLLLVLTSSIETSLLWDVW